MTAYAMGTSLDLSPGPFGQIIGGRVLCSDGKVRSTRRVGVPDTMTSVPGAVRVRDPQTGRLAVVSGKLMIETLRGWTTETPDDPTVVKFVASGRNAHLLPPGLYRGDVVTS